MLLRLDFLGNSIKNARFSFLCDNSITLRVKNITVTNILALDEQVIFKDMLPIEHIF